MSTNLRSRRGLQIAAWAIASLFLLGFFFPLLGAWTGAIMGAWFVGTQRPWRGFLWMMAFNFIPSLLAHWRPSSWPAVEYLGWILLAALLGVLPFVLHRLTSPRLPGFVSTLPLPLWGAVFQTLGAALLPATLAPGRHRLPIGARTFLIYWFAATLIWMWNHEFRAARIAGSAAVFGVVYAALFQLPPIGAPIVWTCLAGALLLGGWAFLRPGKPHTAWADRPAIVSLLRSPQTGDPLQVVREQDREILVGPSGERFPIRDGIPVFLTPDDLTGANRKYNHLYETIAGFYDDTQRVVCALGGKDRDEYVMSYLGALEVKPGDAVLETSVGTGLNFKYLPRGVQRFGLDLSAEMLANCQANLRRWEMDADLFRGNAERLPFADASFDVVFHSGGINFFNDRAQAIREMIRVAKPGTRILIADETEEHVKGAYERFPITRWFYKNRQEAVAAPVDLVPPEMLEVRLETVWNNRFYALTFRKPPAG
jgi:ubiquinone/menaquinone biosynthesis C-methylase UbiE